VAQKRKPISTTRRRKGCSHCVICISPLTEGQSPVCNDSVKQPNLAFEFLRTFNSKLDPSGGLMNKGTVSTAAIKKAVASSKGAVLLGRTNGLHRMTVFGLKYAHLSRRTVALLEVSASALAEHRVA
jgi:hypothetical protein